MYLHTHTYPHTCAHTHTYIHTYIEAINRMIAEYGNEFEFLVQPEVDGTLPMYYVHTDLSLLGEVDYLIMTVSSNFGMVSLCVCVCVCIYIYIYIYMHTYMHTYVRTHRSFSAGES